MARNFTAASSQELRNTGIAAVTAAPLTMACWFRSSDVAGAVSKTLIALDDGASEFFLLRSASTTGACQAAVTGGHTAAAGNPTLNQWSHFGAVFVSSTSRFAYHNGVAGAENTNASTPVVTQTHIGSVIGIQFAAGDIAEAAIWGVALSASEMGLLAQGYAPSLIRPGSLLGYWPLSGGQSPEPDKSIHARVPLVLVNNPPSVAHPPFIIYPRRQGARGGRRSRRVA